MTHHILMTHHTPRDGGSCILYGYVFSSSQVPPKSSAWQLYCGTAYVTVPLTIETSCICKVGFAGDECEDASAATCNSEGADVKSLVVAGACDRYELELCTTFHARTHTQARTHVLFEFGLKVCRCHLDFVAVQLYLC